ncbi:hypothetical protein OH77DRAFT_483941 [Trametes cingulata]|nr:hypothetical protein OH77DRAFT_483941 [Trametes cingulata]
MYLVLTELLSELLTSVAQASWPYCAPRMSRWASPGFGVVGVQFLHFSESTLGITAMVAARRRCTVGSRRNGDLHITLDDGIRLRGFWQSRLAHGRRPWIPTRCRAAERRTCRVAHLRN